MAEFMEGRGLQGQGGLAWAEEHLDPRLGTPMARALHREQVQHGSAMAGSDAAVGLGL